MGSISDLVGEDFSALRVAAVYICVIIVAAAIGYLGNQLGRWIGKRKMSIGRLRPRHTSIVITTFTGAFIAVLTLTFFAIVSEPVRGLLFGVEKLRREEAALRKTVEELKRTVEEGTFIWTKGERIVHMTLPEGFSQERTRDAVTSLLAEANTRTVLRNNKIAHDKKEPPLNVADIWIESDSTNLDETIKKLSQGDGVAGLRVVADRNCLYREKAPVLLQCWPVKLVFKKDEIVLRKKINSSDMVTSFYQFIEEMGKQAIKKGMIPIDGSLGGGMSQEDFKALQEEMNRQEGDFYLVAKAKRDLYETNSLDTTILVEPDANN